MIGVGIGFILGYFVGASWLQTKETNFGVKANFNCDNCEAIGCQFKWCSARRGD